MNNIKIVYQYDGGNYFGMQKQFRNRTIEGEIVKIIEIIAKEKINLITAGRTDRGVHALCQVSNFHTHLNIDAKKWKYILNRGLPNDIRVVDVAIVDKKFHSRFDAKKREYEYRISWDESPFKSRYNLIVKQEIDSEKLKQILKVVEGVHNFKNFKIAEDVKKNTTREIYEVDVLQVSEKEIKIKISAPSFLRSQVRIIVGTALDIYFERADKNTMIEMLNNFDRDYKKTLAEPQGLFLSKIEY